MAKEQQQQQQPAAVEQSASSEASSLELSLFLLSLLDKEEAIPDSAQVEYQGKLLTHDPTAKSLQSLWAREMVTFDQLKREVWTLTDEGSEIVEQGSHEWRVFQAVKAAGPDGIEMKQLQEQLGPAASIGQGRAMKNKWISKAGSKLVAQVETIVDETRDQLAAIRSTGASPDAKVTAELKKRKLCDKQNINSFRIAKGPKFALDIAKQETDLTYSMMQSGAWANADFKKYNFAAQGVVPPAGALHPLMKIREELRNNFFEMGFEEMPTNRYVESSFWNFDVLYVPQKHPARDLQDTFFIKTPADCPVEALPKDTVELVKQFHETGGHGSVGYRYDWSIAEAQKLVLRTHTTAVSARMLYHLAQEAKRQGEEFKSAKFFSIDRVFRNETVDATHLAEFNQVEGVIADRNITLGGLIGFMNQFFSKMGIKDLRFKPAYNPYTEPSLEIFAWFEGLNRWIEIGNSGMFRPEMLISLGLPPDMRVYGWGLSLERPTMMKYGVTNIRELLGPKTDIAMIRNNPVCRLDKPPTKGALAASGESDHDGVIHPVH
ncbi:hypothetical protein GQ42DRAFT_161071 [Ramicandelaber brevisporus]|nr:hypothetical protein GQ42DRAFT_161071 [Ramicandelaber brevisporus]